MYVCMHTCMHARMHVCMYECMKVRIFKRVLRRSFYDKFADADADEVNVERLWGILYEVIASVVQGLDWQVAFDTVGMCYQQKYVGDHVRKHLGIEHCAAATPRRPTEAEFNMILPKGRTVPMHTVLPAVACLTVDFAAMGGHVLRVRVPDVRTRGVPVATRLLVGPTYRAWHALP